MPFLDTTALSLVDIALLLIIVIGLPVEALINLKKSREELASGAPGVRVKHYFLTILMLWGIALPILVVWAAGGRNWAELGFTLQAGWMAYVGWALAALIGAFFVYQHSVVSASAKTREEYREGLAKNPLMGNFMPHNEDEKRVFDLMGITAGITEEIIFRGYLIWAFSLALPLWGAAIAALLVFTFLHIYQGARQLPAIFAMGGLITLVFVLSGSIWPAIALHIFVDVINNSTIWKARTLAAV